MKKLVSLALCLMVLSGCAGWKSASQPAEAPVVPVARPAPERAVPEEARRLLEQAKNLWEEDQCTDPDKAAAWLDMALEQAPDYAEALLWRGRALSDAGYLEDAFDDLTRSLQLHPTALAYAARGLTGLRLQQSEGAARDLAYAIRLDPDEPHAYIYRAASLFLQNKATEACADLALSCSHGICFPLENAREQGICQ